MNTSHSAPLSSLPADLQNNPLLTFCRSIASYSAIKPEHISLAIEFLLRHTQTAVDTATNPNTPSTWEELAEPPEDATETLERSWGVVSHLNSVADTSELRAAYGAMLPKVTDSFSSLGQTSRFIKSLKSSERALNLQPSIAPRKK